MIPYQKRRVVPDEPTLVTVEVRDGAVLRVYDVPLKEVRDGFAFTADDVPYCLEDGAQYCCQFGGVYLSASSLAVCQKMAERIPAEAP